MDTLSEARIKLKWAYLRFLAVFPPVLIARNIIRKLSNKMLKDFFIGCALFLLGLLGFTLAGAILFCIVYGIAYVIMAAGPPYNVLIVGALITAIFGAFYAFDKSTMRKYE